MFEVGARDALADRAAIRLTPLIHVHQCQVASCQAARARPHLQMDWVKVTLVASLSPMAQEGLERAALQGMMDLHL